jgi:protein involved in polysaccharide export with SLBB domain
MQFGGFPRVQRFGWAFLSLLLCVGAASAQIDQTLGGAAQTNCSPLDPTCGTSNQQTQTNPPYLQQQQPSATTTQGIILQPTETGVNPNNLSISNQSLQRQNPPQPLDSPTEFQQTIANSLGRMLPIYGASLFRNPPSTFAPGNLVPVTPDYVVGPGDELLIQLWGQVTLNSRFTVDRTGSVYIPQVGSVHVAGMHYGQVHDYLKSQIGRVFRNFDLNVNMGQLRSIQVFVVGQAQRPGSYTISSLSTLVNALFATGGPKPQGSLRHIQLKRGNTVVVDFDLYDLLLHGDKSKDAPLLPGDVIYIPPVGPQVAVAGSVNSPGIYELKPGQATTVGEILELAAGLTSVASGENVRLERVDERRLRSIIQFPLDARGQSTVLQDGDLLELVAVVNQYKDAVTLRGNVANPGRYSWKPGMRVRDLLPNKEALITRDYWLKRSQLGQPGLTYIPTCPPQTPYGLPTLRYGIPVGEEGLNPNWRYSSTRNPYLTGLPFGNTEGAGGTLTPDGTRMTDGGLDCGQITELATPYSVQNDIYTNPQTGTATQQQQQPQPQQQPFPGQTLQSGMQQPQTPRSYMQTSSAAASVGVAEGPAHVEFRPRNDVKLSEPDIDWGYAVIERQSKENLTTSLLSFNLGKVVLEADSSQNLELLPGDVVTIFSKADIRVPHEQQTKFVRLEGEFVSAGIYSVKPGETLRQLVQRAGGITPQAYLYGSDFTRESTRRVQQQRLDEYVNQISLQASANATNAASKAISPNDAAAAQLAQAQVQNVVTSLRQARATGRVVLDLAPNSSSVSDLPDMPLEDGDRFILPRVPEIVSVDGAVYNQNSFLYDPHRRLGDYIKLAGGANRDADKGRAYVIRASGGVISKQYSSSLRGNGFDSVKLYPGDTVVVPINLDKGKTMRTIVDIAQIVGQFGIAIAAANVVLGQ